MEPKDIVYAVGIGLTFILGVINLFYTRSATKKADFIKTVTNERVKWIENLRQNVSRFTGKIRYFARNSNTIDPKKAHDIVEEILTLSYLIRLQLNPKEEPDAEIERLAEKMPGLLSREKMDELGVSLDRLLVLTQGLLKNEWEKIKTEATNGKVEKKSD